MSMRADMRMASIGKPRRISIAFLVLPNRPIFRCRPRSIRADREPENREGDRADDPGVNLVARRRGDRIKRYFAATHFVRKWHFGDIL